MHEGTDTRPDAMSRGSFFLKLFFFFCHHGSPLNEKVTSLEERGAVSRSIEAWKEEDFAGSNILQSLPFAS